MYFHTIIILLHLMGSVWHCNHLAGEAGDGCLDIGWFYCIISM